MIPGCTWAICISNPNAKEFHKTLWAILNDIINHQKILFPFPDLSQEKEIKSFDNQRNLEHHMYLTCLTVLIPVPTDGLAPSTGTINLSIPLWDYDLKGPIFIE